ncbi:hypothetical protein DH2020_033566 [Rehmannia glutinosa]|uniref:RING-type E3 ubiquitin transferase n=1 Tax=Rehmannia glutinosa TaxID=99300 RepID=A0ABR0VBY4_REHGL
MELKWVVLLKVAYRMLMRGTRAAHSNSRLVWLDILFHRWRKSIGRKQPNQVYYNVGKSLILRIRPNFYKTIAEGVYKVEAFLYIRSPYQYYGNRSDSGYGGSYHRRNRARGSIKFLLTGFWSEISRKLCMVGSGSFEALNLDVVLKVNYASENSTIYTGIASGTLESIGSENDPGYFDPILIFSFPVLSNYNYSLVSREFGGGFVEVAKNQPFGVQPIRLCSLFSSILEMEYEMECRGSQDCSPLGLSRRFLDFSPIQCSERKLRFMAKLQNINYVDPEEFGFESTFIGEASWDDKFNQLFGVACRLLNPAKHSGNAVGDCAMRLSLRYSSIWTIRNEPKVVGQFWSTKNVEDNGYFRKINLTSVDLVAFSDLRYEYSELDRAKTLCPVKKLVKKGNIYPDGHSYDMGFDMSVKNSKGKNIAWGSARPISVGNDLFDRNSMIIAVDAMAPEPASEFTTMSAPAKSSNISPSNISYKISINPSSKVKFGNWFQMSTCQRFFGTEWRLLLKEFITLKRFAPLNEKKGGLIKGTIESTRNKTDPLHFEDLSLSSVAYYTEVAEKSIWRMDLEITMVLISNTLSCIFIGLQIFHVKRNPEGSAEKALSEPFYVGTSVVRLLPHAYNQYRTHNYAAFDVNGTYYYANPAADFYSTAWDVLIPCGVIALAVIVFLQQRNGGRWILPRRFRELELYEKVPVVNNE